MNRKKRIAIAVLIVGGIFLLGLSACRGTGTPASAVMFRGDLAHSGVYDAGKNVQATEWKFKTGGAIQASPVILNGVLYISSSDNKLYAVSLSDGKEKWAFDGQDILYSSPAIVDGAAYLGSSNGMIYAVDIQNGQKKWEYQTGGHIYSSPAVANGVVYIGSGDGLFYAINASDGSKKWVAKTNGPIYDSPSVYNGAVYFGSGDTYMYALDANTGQPLWNFDTDDWILSSPAISNNTLYFGSYDRNLYAVDFSNPKKPVQKWRFETRGIIESSPAVVNGVVYFGSSDGYLYAVDQATGNQKWKFATDAEVYSSPAVSNGVIFFDSENGSMYALDAQSGQVKWQYKTSARLFSSPAVISNMVYFGGEDGYVYSMSLNGPQAAQVFPAPTLYPGEPQPTPAPAQSSSGSAGGPISWNNGVYYEIFIRSFSDSNGDGIGDIQGIINKLDYLNDGKPDSTTSLGVSGIILLPVEESASYHGYDATNFEQVKKEYGSNDDFKRLVSEAHKRGMTVMIDLPLINTSDQNPWFVKSRSPGSQYDNWYIWSKQDPKFSGPDSQQVWWPDLGRFYYGILAQNMPSLNYHNPAVTQAIDDVARFWLQDMGVDGFRLDYLKYLTQSGTIQENTADTHEWLRNFYSFVHSINSKALLIGDIESIGTQIAPYVGDQVDTAFEYDLSTSMLESIRQSDVGLLSLAQSRALRFYQYSRYSMFATNQYQTRAMTELNGNQEAARLAAAIVLTDSGTPFVYYGEELGMADNNLGEVIRGPMQWDATPNTGGFTTGKPWVNLGGDYKTNNVATENQDPKSMLNTYRSLIHLRNNNPALNSGDMVLVNSDNRAIYSYIRFLPNEKLLVINNLSDKVIQQYSLDLNTGPLAGTTGASTLYGVGQPTTPQINSAGGFSGYKPLPAIPPYGTVIIKMLP